MQWYEAEVRSLEQRFKATPLPRDCAAFYGSSSIRMWDSLAVDLNDRRAVNLGFGGSTLAACVYFFNRLVPPLKPASMIVYAGDNDLGDGQSPEEVLRSFRDLMALVRRALPRVTFNYISIKISPARFDLRDRIVRTNELIRNEMGKTCAGEYIDVSQGMLDSSGRPRAGLFSEDGLHLSRAGYRLWAELLKPYRNSIFTPLSHSNGAK